MPSDFIMVQIDHFTAATLRTFQFKIFEQQGNGIKILFGKKTAVETMQDVPVSAGHIYFLNFRGL